MEWTGVFSVQNRSGIPLKEVLIVVVVVVVVGGKILEMSKFIGADFDDHAKTRGATVKRS